MSNSLCLCLYLQEAEYSVAERRHTCNQVQEFSCDYANEPAEAAAVRKYCEGGKNLERFRKMFVR